MEPEPQPEPPEPPQPEQEVDAVNYVDIVFEQRGQSGTETIQPFVELVSEVSQPRPF
jgi:hypothetical protein